VRTVQTLKTKSVLSTLVLMFSLYCEAQSNVYSLAIYSGGTSYRQLCSFSFPFPPYRYELTERSWREDANGLTIMDIRHKKAPGEVLRRSLEVECGSASFIVPLDSVPSKKVASGSVTPGVKGSGNLAPLVTQCTTNRGGHLTTNTLPAIEASWIHHSQESQDLVVVDGDHFTEVQRFLELAYGAPDTEIRSPTPPGNGRSLTYAPKQIGVVLVVMADSRQTILSVVGKQKR
jgi:hypothetical protein